MCVCVCIYVKIFCNSHIRARLVFHLDFHSIEWVHLVFGDFASSADYEPAKTAWTMTMDVFSFPPCTRKNKKNCKRKRLLFDNSLKVKWEEKFCASSFVDSIECSKSLISLNEISLHMHSCTELFLTNRFLQHLMSK